MEKENDIRKAANKKVIELLREYGDDLEKKREVTHWFYFKTNEDLMRFEKYSFEIGFKILDRDAKPNKGKYLLIIFRKEKINEDSINFDTVDFGKKAEEFNGFYDGWETCMEME